jgi:hypothetical protein
MALLESAPAVTITEGNPTEGRDGGKAGPNRNEAPITAAGGVNPVPASPAGDRRPPASY